MAGCSSDVSDLFLGTRGRADILANKIYDAKGKLVWRYQGPKPGMYDVEHQELFAAIRSGKVINNGVYMARSTMLAILGRMATHSGQTITWDQAIHSGLKLAPEKYAMDATPPIVPDKDGKYPVSVPGVTKVV